MAVKTRTQSTALRLKVTVQLAELPPPSAWSFRLDLWQNPWVIAWYYELQPWSDAHRALLEAAPEALCGRRRQLHHDLRGPLSMVGQLLHDRRRDDRVDQGDRRLVGVRLPHIRRRECDARDGSGHQQGDHDLYTAALGESLSVPGSTHGEPGRREVATAVRHIQECVACLSRRLEAASRPQRLVGQDVSGHQREPARADAGCNQGDQGAFAAMENHLRGRLASRTRRFGGRLLLRLRQGARTDGHRGAIGPRLDVHLLRVLHAAEAEYVRLLSAGRGSPAWPGTRRRAATTASCAGRATHAWPADPVRDARHVLWPAGDTFLVYPGSHSSTGREALRGNRRFRERSGLSDSGLLNRRMRRAGELVGELDQYLTAVGAEREFAEARMRETLAHATRLRWQP